MGSIWFGMGLENLPPPGFSARSVQPIECQYINNVTLTFCIHRLQILLWVSKENLTLYNLTTKYSELPVRAVCTVEMCVLEKF